VKRRHSSSKDLGVCVGGGGGSGGRGCEPWVSSVRFVAGRKSSTFSPRLATS
jgi:hypothetical protein